MNQTRVVRVLCLTLAFSAAFGSTGCLVNMMALPYFLIAGDPRVPPPVNVLADKKPKKIVVLAHADNDLKLRFDAVDDDLAKLLAATISKEEPKIQTVSDRKLRQWRDTNPNWADSDLQSIGERFDADYVLFVEIHRFAISDGKNQYLLQGKCVCDVRVHDVSKETLVLTQSYEKEYPPNRHVPLSDVASETQFRNLFLRKLAEEISWYILPHEMGDQISDI